MLKDDLNNREFTGKVLTSAGMGKQYFERGDWEFNKYNGKNTREYYVFKNGTRAMMPRYYRDKIYSEEENNLRKIISNNSQNVKIRDNKNFQNVLYVINGMPTFSDCFAINVQNIESINVLKGERAKENIVTGKDRKSTRLNSSHITRSRMPSSA